MNPERRTTQPTTEHATQHEQAADPMQEVTQQEKSFLDRLRGTEKYTKALLLMIVGSSLAGELANFNQAKAAEGNKDEPEITLNDPDAGMTDSLSQELPTNIVESKQEAERVKQSIDSASAKPIPDATLIYQFEQSQHGENYTEHETPLTGELPTQDIAISSYVGSYIEQNGKQGTEDNARREVALFQVDEEVQPTGRSTEVTAIGDTPQEAQINALEDAAQYFQVNVDSVLTSFQQERSGNAYAGVSAEHVFSGHSQDAQLYIDSYTVLQSAQQVEIDGKPYWQVQLKVNEGAVQPNQTN